MIGRVLCLVLGSLVAACVAPETEAWLMRQNEDLSEVRKILDELRREQQERVKSREAMRRRAEQVRDIVDPILDRLEAVAKKLGRRPDVAGPDPELRHDLATLESELGKGRAGLDAVLARVDAQGRRLDKLAAQVGGLEEAQGKTLTSLDTRLREILERLQGLEAATQRAAEAKKADAKKAERKKAQAKKSDRDRITRLEEALDMLHGLDRKVGLLSVAQTALRAQVEAAGPEAVAKASRAVADAVAARVEGRLDQDRAATVADVEAKLSASRQDAAAALDALWTKIRARFAALATDRAKSEQRIARQVAASDAGQAVETLRASTGAKLDALGKRQAAADARLDSLAEAVADFRRSFEARRKEDAGDPAGAGGSDVAARVAAELWQSPFVWVGGVAALLVLLWLLFRKERSELPLDGDEVFVVPDEVDHLETAAGGSLFAERGEPRPPEPQPVRTARDPAPRVQTLRLSAEETVPGGDAAVRGLLDCDPRVLVEPAPRIESRADGSLSIRFYLRGQVGGREAEDLLRACRALASNGRGGPGGP